MTPARADVGRLQLSAPWTVSAGAPPPPAVIPGAGLRHSA